MKPKPQFNIKDVVRRCSSTDQVGVISVATWNAQLGTWHYRVRFGSGTRGVLESDLELLPDESAPETELTSGRLGSAEAFRFTLTYERLAQPPSRIKTAFGSAKAKLLPFQFKPLLKFLESGTQRLLIADDVGLGKTIEAGYILRELSARQHLDRVLIIVPSRLRAKWQAELSRRFDEHFDIVKLGIVRAFLQSTAPLDQLQGFRWITSLEGLRNMELIGLANDRLMPIDLVIFDEAHRLRNTGTLQNKIGGAFTASADAALFLTATPLQTHQDDLFNLLTLLDGDVFNQRDVFNEQLKAQKHVLDCIRYLRHRPPETQNAATSFETFLNEPSSSLIARSEFGKDLASRIDTAEKLERPGMVDLQRDLSELCLTSTIISRTRKTDVLTDRPRRSARSRPVKWCTKALCVIHDDHAESGSDSGRTSLRVGG